MLEKIINFYTGVKNNSLKKSMLLSLMCKPLGMIISFFYTPALLAYLGEEAYGVWATILSVINWINFFDVGIGQGLRNVLCQCLATKDNTRANQVNSTGYIAISIISVSVFTLGAILISCLDLAVIFNTSIPIRSVLMISFACICINFILGLSKSQLYAIQKAEYVGYMSVLTGMLNLLGIILLPYFVENSLVGVAVVIGLSGIIINLIFTRKIWFDYRYLIPHYYAYSKQELKKICSMGVKFFLIQIAVVVLYATDNMIITNLFGPIFVTPYHIVYSVFGLMNVLFGAFISPLWSKYTMAVEQKNYVWIKTSIFKLDKMLPIIGLILIVSVFCFKPVANIWLQKELQYETGLIGTMAFYFFLMIWGSIYATVMNGMGILKLQLILAVSTATINIPLSIFLGKYCELGTTGVCLATVLCMLVSNILITISVHRYLNMRILE
ncbi:lipopolysaccharide biosynthesis protein [Anaerovibrio lipolyticus]|uniref:lipopolysaccharide biosynthesis protein n=1 Tax=Anaerovibrio lipolyticus TaxID=82374 RepID=UPI00047F88D9|nr:MATE family efflux transporter [Anaerovibrio lipolyticus]